MKNINEINEFYCPNVSGWPILGAQALTMLLAGFFFFIGTPLSITIAGIILFANLITLSGYVIIEPNYAAVVMFFGKYKGTIDDNGLRFLNPFFSVRKVSKRIVNFDSNKLKVNDLDGNPIEIGAVVVWKVNKPATALLSVEGFHEFVKVQTESALRTLANHYAYDSHDSAKNSLRDNPDHINKELTTHIQERLDIAGIEILEARISHLAYAQEIAQAMLQRQQASAVVAARSLIVSGAVSIVQMALAELEKEQVVLLDDEKKAQMVSNLLVVLCSEQATTPIINTSSIH